MAHKLEECCMEGTCLDSFHGLPQRVLKADFEPLTYSDLDCDRCTLPRIPGPSPEILQEVDRLKSKLTAENFVLVEVDDTDLVALFCVKHRFQQRRNGGVVRRNVVFVYVIHPSLNLYRFTHFTYRYHPRGCSPDFLMPRLLLEGLVPLREATRNKEQSGFFCVHWLPLM